VQAVLEEEARAKEIAHDALINNERRAHANQVHIKLQLIREVQQGWMRRPGPRRLPMMPSSTVREGLMLTRYISSCSC
jgi:hypothetical protein